MPERKVEFLDQRLHMNISSGKTSFTKKGTEMKDEIIKLSKDVVVFNTTTPKEIGENTDLKVALPEDLNLKSFTINGTVTDCRHIRNNGSSVYMLEMNIEGLPEKDDIILDAYIDFLEREEVLGKIKSENMELQDALTNLGEKLTELISVSEMLIKESQSKITIH